MLYYTRNYIRTIKISMNMQVERLLGGGKGDWWIGWGKGGVKGYIADSEVVESSRW